MTIGNRRARSTIVDEHVPTGSWTARWLSLTALVLGLVVAGVSTVALGSQLWHVKRLLDRQRRAQALVAEVGLSRDLVPRVQSSNRWAIGGSTGVVLGLFWFVWGAVRLRDQRRRAAPLAREQPGDNPSLFDAAPARAASHAKGTRPARRRSKHRRRR